MSQKVQRTDVHRPGAIVPAHYTSWCDYSLSSSEGGCPIPRWGVDCADSRPVFDERGLMTGHSQPTCPDTGRCCVTSAVRHAQRAGRAAFGHPGKCGVCGARFTYGTLFRHDDGDVVHLGHDCADKYGLMFDLSAHELQQGRVRSAHAKAIARAEGDRARRAFLEEHPGLEGALALGKADGTRSEAILAEMAGKFTTYRSLSTKQIQFATKLADEIQNPKPEAVEAHCAAPLGKGVTFEGEIVSCKLADGYAGGLAYKMTVRVTTEAGATWLAYGTCPTSLTGCLHGGSGKPSDLRGRLVEIRASLELPRDRRNGEDHFVFMGRPSARFVDVVDHPVYQAPKAPRVRRAKSAKTEAPSPPSGETSSPGLAP